MGKQVTRLNEAQLHKVIEEATIKILRENKCNEGWIKNMFGATAVTEERLNELSQNTEGNAIRRAAQSRRYGQMRSMTKNAIDKYNSMFKFTDCGYTFEIEEYGDGRTSDTEFVISATHLDGKKVLYSSSGYGQPVPYKKDENNNKVYITVDNIIRNFKTNNRRKFGYMLDTIEKLNNTYKE